MRREPEPGAGLLPRRPQRVQPAGRPPTIVTPGGALRRPTATATAATRPTPAAVTNVGVQPAACRPATSGNAATTCPACPSSPVSWVTRGARRAGNHAGISRSTLMNVIASPAPTSTRAASPSDRLPAAAISSCPPAMSTAPATIMRREPTRSSTTPTGTCIPAYTASWTTPSSDSTPALIPKRCCASRPATPSEARWKTRHRVREDAKSHITQARRATVRTTRRNTLRCIGIRDPRHRPPYGLFDRAVSPTAVRTPDEAAVAPDAGRPGLGTRPVSSREVPARPFARISTVSSWPLPLSASARCRSRDPTARGCGRRASPGRTIRAFRTPGLQRLSVTERHNVADHRRGEGHSQPRRTASTPAWNRLDAPSRRRMSATCRR